MDARRSLQKNRRGGRYKYYLTSPSPLKSMPRRSLYDKKRRKVRLDQNNEEASDSNLRLIAHDQRANSTCDQDPAVEKSACELTETLPSLLENVSATNDMGSPDTCHSNDSEIDSEDVDVCVLPSDEEGDFLMRNQLKTSLLQYGDSNSENEDDDRDVYADEDWYDVEEQVINDDSMAGAKDFDFNAQLLYEGAPVSVETSLLLIMTFSTRHCLTGDALTDLLELIAIHCPSPNLCKTTLYQFKKHFRDLKTPIIHHYYCPFCQGLLEDGLQTTTCKYCSFTLCKDEQQLKKSFFIEMPIKQQLADLFLIEGFYDDLGYRFRRKKKVVENIEDVQDGLEYKRLMDKNGFWKQQGNVALQLNTDGVTLFKSSPYKIWPVYFTILDLPPCKRYLRENLLFAGLWFGGPPVMNTFLKPYIKSLMELEHAGVSVKLNDGKELVCKCVLLNGVFDLPARCQVCDMIQFNGHCGCGLCEEPGETVNSRKNGGHSHVYPMSHEKAKTVTGHEVWRTKESTEIYAEEAIKSGKVVKGVKGRSILSFLPNFDITKGVPVDYMHCVLLGVAKAMTALWFSSQFSQEEWYCGNRVKEVDRLLAKIKPPNEMTRVPRSIENHRKYWKASELRSWLFHYSVPVMIPFLKAAFLHHWMMLVKGVFNLCQDSISGANLNESFILLKTFVYYTDKLYGPQACTANVHYLLHLPQCVIWNGPLWSFSCFTYEDANGSLRKLFHGTQHIEMQISAAASLTTKLPSLAKKIPEESHAAHLYKRMTNKYHLAGKNWELVSDSCYLIGTPRQETLTGPVAVALRQHFGVPVSTAYIYSRAILRGRVYHSRRYERAQKRNSYTVMYKEDANCKYGQIEYFTKVRENHCHCLITSTCTCRSWQYLAMVNQMVLASDSAVKSSDGVVDVLLHHQVKVHPIVSGNLTAVPVKNIVTKVVCLDIRAENQLVYLSQLPNHIEKD